MGVIKVKRRRGFGNNLGSALYLRRHNTYFEISRFRGRLVRKKTSLSSRKPFCFSLKLVTSQDRRGCKFSHKVPISRRSLAEIPLNHQPSQVYPSDYFPAIICLLISASRWLPNLPIFVSHHTSVNHKGPSQLLLAKYFHIGTQKLSRFDRIYQQGIWIL